MSAENAAATVNPLDAPVTREQARPQLEQLRADRLAGKVTEHDYLARADYLARLDAGEQVEPPKLYPTMQEKFEQQYDEHMRAPEPEHYSTLPRARVFDEVAEEGSLEFDSAVRAAFHRGGIPNHLAGPILEGVIRTWDTLAKAPRTDVETRLQSTASKLREMWGPDYKARLDRVNDLVADMVEADEGLAAMFDRRPWLLHADVAVMDYLDRVASHKAAKAKR